MKINEDGSIEAAVSNCEKQVSRLYGMTLPRIRSPPILRSGFKRRLKHHSLKDKVL